MSVRVDGAAIHVEGNGAVEDAEPILVALQEDPQRIVDLAHAGRLHTASVQVLLALRPTIVGAPSDSFQAKHISLIWLNEQR